MSEKKENDSSEQPDLTDDSKEREVEDYFNKLRIMSETCNDGSFEEAVREICLTEESNKEFRRFLSIKQEFKEMRKSSSVSLDSQTDPEASKKDTASSIEKKFLYEDDIDSELKEYLKTVKHIEMFESVKLEVEEHKKTEQIKEKDCSKDCSSSNNTQTEIFLKLNREIENFNKTNKKERDINLVRRKLNLFLQLDKKATELKVMVLDAEKLKNKIQSKKTMQ